MERIGRYELVKRIAAGGMAEIFLARQVGPEGFEKYVVIKRILPHLAENREFVEMFLQEARLAVRLNHPNIAQVFDLGESSGSYFIAMEYVHGEDLRRMWRHSESVRNSIPVPLVCRIVMEAAAGLDYAHKKSGSNAGPLDIVHRDVSPQNILVSFDGVVKVVDFGIAKATDQANNTHPGVLKGKYSYMSPEQAGGFEVDWRTDQFALGIIFYELLTLTRLFKRRTDIQTLAAVGECKIPAPSQVHPRVPAELEVIVLKALAKRPEDRYRDMHEFRLAIEDWLLAHRHVSSATHLAKYMGSIYAERLEKEKAEGLAACARDIPEPDGFWQCGKATRTKEARPEGVRGKFRSSEREEKSGKGSKKESVSGSLVLRWLGQQKRLQKKVALGVASTFALVAAALLHQSQGSSTIRTIPSKYEQASLRLLVYPGPPIQKDGGWGAEKNRIIDNPPDEKSRGVQKKEVDMVLPEKVSKAQFGVLAVTSEPSAFLWKGPQRLGKTPLRVRLSVGRHHLALVNQEHKLEQGLEVTIQPNETLEKEYRFGRGDVQIVVKPASMNVGIYLRGVQLGSNPLPKFSLLEGEYQFTVVSEELRKTKKVPVQVRRNQVARVVVDFEGS